MQYVLLAVLIVLVIGFFYVMWKAASSWSWYVLLCLAVTMLLSVAFLFPTAQVLKSRSAWHKLKEDQEATLQRLTAEREALNFGDPSDPAAGKGVLVLTQELARLSAEAGRRWRNLQFEGTQGEAIRLVQPQPQTDNQFGGPPADAPPAADADPPGSLIPESLVVYAFGEAPMEGVDVPVPNLYLGEFRVTASDPQTVTIEPISPLSRSQIQAIGTRETATWSLYELLPLDGHLPFIAEGSQENEENIFGRVDEDLVKTLLGSRVDAITLQSYLRDGTRANPDDPQATRWVKIQFIKEYTFDVDSLTQTGVMEGGFFDGSGRAVDSRLQRTDAGVKFDKDQELIVKEEAADELINDGIARSIDTFYVRPLNDYRFGLRNIRLRLAELVTRREELEFEKKVLDQAVTSSQNLLVEYQGEAIKLEEDLAQTRAEKTALTRYVETLKSRLEESRETLTRLYTSNVQLENELQRIAGKVAP